MKKILLLITCLVLFSVVTTSAQSVLNPADTIVTYNSAAPPTLPAYGQIGKWVRTSRLSWNTSGFKCYIYKGIPFRLKFPASYKAGVADGKQYPVYLFFHGAGESGTVYDNEFQLYHGGDVFNNATNNGSLDGFLIYPQSTDGSWGNSQYDVLAELIKLMSAQVKADLNKVSVNGLSAGGYASWEFMMRYPYLVSAALPMSAIANGYTSGINNYKFTPIWYFQGGQDAAPAPYTANQVTSTILAAGSNLKYTLYPDLGHGTWDRSWSEADFIPFMLRANVLNPYALFGRYQFCTGDAININVGIAPGFAAYQWRKDSAVISGATTNVINVTSLGSYSVRVKRNTSDTAWTIWSPTPLNVAIKAPTVTPPISISTLTSKVLPAPDGSTTVPLLLPAGYATYTWQRVGNTTVISTNDTLLANAGDYRASVTETYGCASSYSAPFHVVSATGANPPDAISGLTVTSTSQTALTLNWTDKPNPTYNETNFEVYRTTTPGSNYKLVAKVNPDIVTYKDSSLLANTTYYYIVRPVNENGAAPVSAEANGTTQADRQIPTAPGTLTLTGSSLNSLSISWLASTDNVAVTGYDVYVNGAKSYALGNVLVDTIFGLTARQVYTIYVVAKDAAGNASNHSNQLSATTVNSGIGYKYYQGSWSTLPAFSTLTPVASGRQPVPSLTPHLQETNFAFLWQGFLTIPTAGTYTFQTTSDDGSKFYFNKPYSDTATATVNNDGLHGSQSVNSADFVLQPGVYPIAASYMQQGGGYNFTLSWKSAAVGATAFTVIPNTYLGDTVTVPGTAPLAPGYLNAAPVSFKKVTLTWADSSSNETGFEIYRASTGTGTYTIIGTVGANVTTFDDNNVSPATYYYYKVRSINKYGASAFAGSYDYSTLLPLNNNLQDLSYYGNTLTLSGATYSATAPVEGAASLLFNGTSNYASIGGSTSGYLHTAFTSRTVSLWIKAAATNNNRVIFDLGGSDNGMALRINAGALEAAVDSGSTRVTITTPFTSTAWTHVAVVYGNKSLRLYVNGALATSIATTFGSIATTTNNSRIASTNGTNAFNVTGAFFSGNIDYFTIINAALSQAEVGQLSSFTLPIPATLTPALPSAPGVPTALTAAGNSPKTVALAWTNNGTAATSIEIDRATGTSTNYVAVKTIAGTATAYTDSALFANQQYTYKIRAIGDGGTSAFSSIVSATTLNSVPVAQNIPNQSARYDAVTQIAINATDADGDAITYSALNLPSFVTLAQGGTTGEYLNIAPDATLQGTYNNLSFIVTDTHGGKDTVLFNLVINDNYSPVIGALSAVTLNEGVTQQVTATATDQNAGDSLTWSGIQLPSFVTLTPSGRSVVLNLKPGYADAGTYTVQLQIADGNGGISTQSFTLTVADKNPNYKLFVRFKYNTDAPAPWNSVTGVTTNNLKNDNGETTNVSLQIQNPTYQTWNEGTSTGGNTGVYPDVVLKEYYFFGSYPGIFNSGPTTDMKLTGLDANRKYSFKFMGASNWSVQSNNGTTIYTINGVSKSVSVQGNTSTTVNFDNISPDSTGTILFTTSLGANTLVGYLNAFEVNAILNDGTAPAAPKTLTATQANGVALLNWTNTAYNATGVEVDRSSDSLGVYAPIAVLTSATAAAYNDSTIHGNHNYYYQVRAVNSVGYSPFSNIAGVVVPNKAPTMDSIPNVVLKAGGFVQSTVTSHPDGSNTVVLTTTGLPSFATFTDNGNGTGSFNVSPTADNLGTTVVTVTATDNTGAAVTRSFSIVVGDLNTTSTYFNFNTSTVAGAPWNTITGFPYGGTKVTNATDENGNGSGITMAFTENWENSSSNNGMSTYDNTGIYPDKVMTGDFYESSTSTHTINLTGLNSNKRYNVVFFNSINFGVNGKTQVVINGNTIILTPSYNTSKTSQINGLSPDNNGKISIAISKVSGANYMYLNAMVVEAYDTALAIVNPVNLKATATGADRIALNWADRAYNESGYQIYRAVSGTNYSLIATTAANATAYLDSSLSANVKYYYKVRAINATINSDFSNGSSATTLALNVYVNFDQSYPGVAPWNNTNQSPQVGTIFTSMKDAAGNQTGIGLNVQENFDGIYGAGVNTGNNSGIYSDAVMRENYGVFPGRHASFNLTGLNQTLQYDLVFFASSTEYADITSKYTINGTKVSYLNASLNTNGTVTVHNVLPTATGGIHVDVDPGTPTSGYGLIAALVIQAHLDPATQNESGPSNGLVNSQSVAVAHAVVITNEEDKTLFGIGKAYPNPFDSYVNVDISLKTSTDLLISIFDLSGRLMYNEYKTSVPGGSTTLRINTGSYIKTPGMYLLRLSNAKGDSKVFRLIKK